LEEWIILGVKKGHNIPTIDGLDININEVV
jgi:hypothetical protein